MLLTVTRIIACDVVHYYNAASGDIIKSTGNRFEAQLGGRAHRFTIPVPFLKNAAMAARLLRRSLRLDKSNVVINSAGDGLVILYLGAIWFYEVASGALARTGALRQCRNVLHGGIAVTPQGIYFGEYGRNPRRAAVPLWCSRDDGRSWRILYETPAGQARHFHAVYADPWSGSLWAPTGDDEGECYLIEFDADFNTRLHGDGTQAWRPVSMFFERDRIIWAMDSQLETPFLQLFDRRTGTLTRQRPFPGPVWYGKQLEDGMALIQTTVEKGPGVKTRHAFVYASRDLVQWEEVARYRKDALPMLQFKFGVVSFADGPQTSGDFVMFGEALRQLDGKAVFARIDDGA